MRHRVIGPASPEADTRAGGDRERRLQPLETPRGTQALVRGVPSTFYQAIRPPGPGAAIDVGRARDEHAEYCRALRSAGLSLIEIAADDRYPDCSFVEDTVVIVGPHAVLGAMAPPSRRGEIAAVEPVIREHKSVHRLRDPATLDGGDVLVIGKTLYVGQSRRTNEAAVAQLDALLPREYEVVPVEVGDVLHLKTACTYLGGDVVLHLPGHIDAEPFAHLEQIVVPEEEAHAANCVAVNGVVLVPSHAPWTQRQIRDLGLETIEVDISESIKAGGRLTCSSVIW